MGYAQHAVAVHMEFPHLQGCKAYCLYFSSYFCFIIKTNFTILFAVVSFLLKSRKYSVPFTPQLQNSSGACMHIVYVVPLNKTGTSFTPLKAAFSDLLPSIFTSHFDK